jgi:glycopeptide antibiotics resistance protein
MLGSFDIEDIILNGIGAMIGFLIARQIKSKKERRI